MGFAGKSSRARRGANAAVVCFAFLALSAVYLTQLARPKATPASRLTPEELGYKDSILNSDLLQPGPLMAQDAAGLQYEVRAESFNHEKALVIDLHNSNPLSSITVDLPAGMLFAPVENRDFQNLVLRDAVSVSLHPGETKRLEQWAFCGNQFHLPPFSQMKASGWVMNAPPCQGCVWGRTLPYEMPVAAAEGHWMFAKLAAAVNR